MVEETSKLSQITDDKAMAHCPSTGEEYTLLKTRKGVLVCSTLLKHPGQIAWGGFTVDKRDGGNCGHAGCSHICTAVMPMAAVTLSVRKKMQRVQNSSLARRQMPWQATQCYTAEELEEETMCQATWGSLAVWPVFPVGSSGDRTLCQVKGTTAANA
ncbi:hypothetical protein AOLI_G00121630 [Acnodon oligacanthus]